MRRGSGCASEFAEAARALDLDVRAGLHSGECESLDEDIAGIAVHIGARVSALAGAGEVFVSPTVKDLVVGSGLEFEPRGTHELKGVPGDLGALRARGRAESDGAGGGRAAAGA